MRTSGTTSDNEWQRVAKQVATKRTMSDHECQQVTTNDNKWLFRPDSLFFREESTNRHPKENPLNFDEDLE